MTQPSFSCPLFKIKFFYLMESNSQQQEAYRASTILLPGPEKQCYGLVAAVKARRRFPRKTSLQTRAGKRDRDTI